MDRRVGEVEVEVREVDGTWCRWISLGWFLLLSREQSPGGLFLFFFFFGFLARRWLDGMRLWHFTAAVFAACIMPQISALVANFSAWFGRGEGLSSVLLRGSEDTITGFMVDFKMNFITSSEDGGR